MSTFAVDLSLALRIHELYRNKFFHFLVVRCMLSLPLSHTLPDTHILLLIMRVKGIVIVHIYKLRFLSAGIVSEKISFINRAFFPRVWRVG